MSRPNARKDLRIADLIIVARVRVIPSLSLSQSCSTVRQCRPSVLNIIPPEKPRGYNSSCVERGCNKEFHESGAGYKRRRPSGPQCEGQCGYCPTQPLKN